MLKTMRVNFLLPFYHHSVFYFWLLAMSVQQCDSISFLYHQSLILTMFLGVTTRTNPFPVSKLETGRTSAVVTNNDLPRAQTHDRLLRILHSTS